MVPIVRREGRVALVIGPPGWRSLVAPLREAGWLLIGLKVILAILALYLIGTETVPGPCNFELARNGWTTIPPLDDRGAGFLLAGVWQRWDACWLGKIATFGYEPGLDSVTFFPAMPLAISWLAPLVGGSLAVAGELIAAAAYLVAIVALLLLVGDDFGASVARRTVLYLSAFPAAFFLFAPFTESLFLASSAVALLGARRQRWWIAAGAALIASLTRTQGLLLVLPLGWEALRTVRARGLLARGMRPVERTVGLLVPALAVSLPVFGFVGYLAAAVVVAGISPLDSQDAWGGRNFHPPWDVAAASWQWVLDHHDSLQLVNLVTLAAAIGLVVAAVRRLPLSYTLLALPQLVLLATRLQPTPLTATTRYVLVVFPVFVVLALLGRSRRFDRLWLVGSSVGLALLASQFVRGSFVA
ncbi:MAG TPA: hypothetical protein VFI28_02195 [Candidatus Limnocylindrales bacterium]|nr:hypothetical protein [Candidatus Limnocylindrales bacterium]